MKKLLFVVSLFCLTAVMQAQILEPVTVKEILPKVKSSAESDFAQDASLTHALFLGIEYQGVRLELDLENGKATGWLFRFFSPSLDSSVYYIGAKVPIIGPQAVKLAVDTLTQYFPVNIGTTGLVEPWVDSDVALQGSRDGGAETFLQQNQDARVALAFTINNPVQNGYIPQGQYWLFRYAASADTLICMVHASSGLPFRCLSGNAPKILSIPPTTARIGVKYSYRVNAYGDPTPVYSLSTAPSGMTIDAHSGMINWSPAAGQEGSQSVTVVATNASGSDTQSFQINVQGSATSPTIVSTPTTEAFAGKPYVYQLVANGSPAPVYTLTEGPQGMLIDGGRGSLFWTPTRAQAAAHPVRISATNAAGSDEQSFTLEVYKEPVISGIPTQTIPPDEEFTLDPAVDARPAPTFTLNAGPDGLSIDDASGRLSWTPASAQEGRHVVLFTASNRAGNGQQSFEIVVDDPTAITTLADNRSFALRNHYPQPARHTLTLQLHSRLAQVLHITVYDLLGRQLLGRSMEMNSGNFLMTLPVNHLANGLYSCRISNGLRQLVTTIVIAR